MTSSSSIAQQLFVIGGSGTLPGYDYRSFAGRRAAVVNVQVTNAVWGHWLGARIVGAAGATDRLRGTTAVDLHAWPVRQTGGLRASAGAGVALFWNMLSVDVVRGLNDGHWQLDLSASRAIHRNDRNGTMY